MIHNILKVLLKNCIILIALILSVSIFSYKKNIFLQEKIDKIFSYKKK